MLDMQVCAGNAYAQKIAREQAKKQADKEVAKLKAGDYSSVTAAASTMEDGLLENQDVAYRGTTEI